MSVIGHEEAAWSEDHWAKKVRRFVLLAGMNRGWSDSGQRPLDMGGVRYAVYWAVANIARITDTGEFVLQMESGAPFVANLRLEWMRLARKLDRQMPPTVRLLGDSDDVVSDADEMDLRVSGAADFCWMRVRGTGHSDIVQANADGRSYNDSEQENLARYRFEKLLRALTKPIDELRRENETQPFEMGLSVNRVVFVLHGIRDLGRWSVDFEEALVAVEAGRQGMKPKELAARRDDKTRIVSPRYGYFGMGPFVLPGKREKYVRWFMDEYTETLATYSKAKQIDFFGHSNGT